LEPAESYTAQLADPFNLRNDYNPAPFDRTHVFNVHYLIDLGEKTRSLPFINKVFKGVQISGITSLQSGPPLASIQGYNFYFGGASAAQDVLYTNQWQSVNANTCLNQLGAGHDQCYPKGSYINNTSWLGTPDVLLMPKILCNPASGLKKNQYINGTCYGMPELGQNGDYRSPYIHGPAFMNHDLSILKNFKMGEKKNLQFRAAAFNFLNHPLVSFNKSSSASLNLSFQELVAGQQIGAANLRNANFGYATAKYGNRLVELSVKYEF
jgi:hypothetical protein